MTEKAVYDIYITFLSKDLRSLCLAISYWYISRIENRSGTIVSMSVTLKHKRVTLLIVTSLLVLIAGGRILRLNLAHKELHIDEVWSIWQLIGNQTDYTRDATWPPLYYMSLDGWRRLVGIDPFSLRYLSVLAFMIGAACTYRLMRRLGSESAAVIGMLAYSATAVGLFMTTQMRGYGFVYSMLPLAMWLTIRYFYHPNLRRAILLALILVTMFYTAYGSSGAFLMLGIYTVLVYRQAIWRWWLPGLMAGPFAVLGVVHLWSLTTGRASAMATLQIPPLLPALIAFYNMLAGYNGLVWGLLIVLAAVTVFIRQRPLQIKTIALLIWGFGAILLYFTHTSLGLFISYYGWFIVLGIVLWIATGVSYLPKVAQIGVMAILVGVMLTPIPYSSFEGGIPNKLGQTFQGLAQTVQWGDVVVIDPEWKTQSLQAEELDYLTKLYFPQGLQIVDNPEGYRRVWYLKWNSGGAGAFEKRITQGRVAGRFFGPPEALFRLYEAPPDPIGVPFDNGLRFHGIELVDQEPGLFVHRILDTVRVRLWWSVDKPLPLDYSIGLEVLNNGRLTIQSDSGPQLIDSALPKATSQWQPGQFYIEERNFTIPRALSNGAFPVYLTVYQWWDNTRIYAPGMNQDKLLPIETLYIKGW